MLNRFSGGKISAYSPVISLAVVAFCTQLGYAVLSISALPVFIKQDLHLTKYLGIILGAFFLTETLLKPICGALGDRIGRKNLVSIGPAISTVTSALTVLAARAHTLVCLRLIDGFGAAAFWPTIFAATGDAVKQERQSTAMSIINAANMAGIALGPLIGGLSNDKYGKRYLSSPHDASFYVASALFFIALLVTRFVYRETKTSNLQSDEKKKPFRLSDLSFTAKYMPDMLFITLITFLGVGVVSPVAKLYCIERLHMSEFGFGKMLAPITIVIGILALPLGRLSDHWGVRRSVSWGITLTAISMWVIAYASNGRTAIFSAAVLGIGFVMAFPAWLALISHLTPRDRRGEVIGSVGVSQGLGMLIGAWLGGWLYGSDRLLVPQLGLNSYNLPFFASAVFLTISTLCCFLRIYATAPVKAVEQIQEG